MSLRILALALVAPVLLLAAWYVTVALIREGRRRGVQLLELNPLFHDAERRRSPPPALWLLALLNGFLFGTLASLSHLSSMLRAGMELIEGMLAGVVGVGGAVALATWRSLGAHEPLAEPLGSLAAAERVRLAATARPIGLWPARAVCAACLVPFALLRSPRTAGVALAGVLGGLFIELLARRVPRGPASPEA